MARDSMGKYVTRAGATGRSRTYRGQRPTNWYLAIGLILVLGLASIVYARSKFQTTSAAAAATAPTVGTTWFSAYDFATCGTQLPPLPASPTAAATGITTHGQGVITIAPTTAAEAGNHATLGRFVAGYPGMKLTADSLQYPGAGQKLYKNGETCPVGTPDAGKKGKVQVVDWASDAATLGTSVKGDPRQLKLGNNALVTVAFAPVGAKIAKPSPQAILAMLQAPNQPTSTITPGSAPVTPGAGATIPVTPGGHASIPVAPGAANPAAPGAATPAGAGTAPATAGTSPAGASTAPTGAGTAPTGAGHSTPK